MDKVQKIREAVKKLKSNLVYSACSSQTAMETCFKEEAYNEVLAILDTMQEEPVSKVWHRGDEFKDIEYQRICKKVIGNMENKRFAIGDVMEVENGAIDLLYEDGCVAMCIRKEDTWAYLDDLLNLSNVQRTVKDLKEPVSKDYRERYKNIAQSDAFKSAYENKSLGEVMSVEGEEPVSEELEKAAVEAFKQIVDSDKNNFLEVFKAGANWQKKQDQESIETAIHHAYHNGRLEMKEKMMAKAIDATIEEPEPLLWRVLGELEGLFVAENNLHDGDGVKVIIIKEN